MFKKLVIFLFNLILVFTFSFYNVTGQPNTRPVAAISYPPEERVDVTFKSLGAESASAKVERKKILLK